MTSLKEEHKDGSLDLQTKLKDIADKKEVKQIIDCDDCKNNETPKKSRKNCKYFIEINKGLKGGCSHVRYLAHCEGICKNYKNIIKNEISNI
jgi:hypothetical protein